MFSKQLHIINSILFLNMDISKKKIITYIAIFLLTSSIGYALVLNIKNWQINPFVSMFTLMWCPAVSAFITQLHIINIDRIDNKKREVFCHENNA